MSDKELQNAVEFKAQQFIPLPMADVNFSWQVLDEDQNQGKKTEIEPKVRVLLTAVPKNVVNNYLKVLDSAGLNPIAIEIESISAIRALIPANSNESILIVDVGAKSTIISMVHSGHLYASRHVSVGGDSITSSIAKSLGITFERAEALKRAPESTGDLSKSTSSVANSVIEVIRGEVQQMNLISENQGKHISKIILSGGGARYPGITELLKQIGPAVEPANPLAPLSFDQNSEDSLHSAAIQLSIAIGLALRP
jgi:type IV pilus assembly protein PilM